MLRLYRFATTCSVALFVFILWSLFFAPTEVSGQEFRASEIASLYSVTDQNVTFGDIISLNQQTGTYQRARVTGDAYMFGVAVQNPVLLYRTGTSTDNIPVVGKGEVPVNVTTLGGPIRIGDYITSSSIPGKGQRAGSDAKFILGIAQESFGSGDGESTTTPTGAVVSVGNIAAKLQIGPHPGEKSGMAGVTEATILNVIQYIVAAFVAVGSVYIAFRNFGPNLREGVESIGRNPLARSSIQSMVVFNAVLIILVSLGGLLLGIVIIQLPI